MQASDTRVADDAWGGARGSGLVAEAHRHPKPFGAEPFPRWASPIPLASGNRGATPHPPGTLFGAPERGRNPTCNPSEVKGLHVSLSQKFEGLQVGLRRPSRAPTGPGSFLFLSAKGARIWLLAQAPKAHDPPPLQVAKGSRIYPASQPPKGARDPPPSQAPKGSRSAPFPKSHKAHDPLPPPAAAAELPAPPNPVNTPLSSLSERVRACFLQLASGKTRA